jgi:hypothetical protein
METERNGQETTIALRKKGVNKLGNIHAQSGLELREIKNTHLQSCMHEPSRGESQVLDVLVAASPVFPRIALVT